MALIPRVARVWLLEPWTNILLQSAFTRKEGRTCPHVQHSNKSTCHQAWFITGNCSSLQRLKAYGSSAKYVSLTGRTHLKQQGKRETWMQLGASPSLIFIFIHYIHGHRGTAYCRMEYTYSYCWGKYILLLGNVRRWRLYYQCRAEMEDHEGSDCCISPGQGELRF